MTVRLEVLGDDGEWHEIPGVTSVEFHQEQPDPRDEAYRRHDAFDAMVYAMPNLSGRIDVPVHRAYLQDEIARAEEQARVIDQDGNPVRPRTDRPAWQSPYGPARRRH